MAPPAPAVALTPTVQPFAPSVTFPQLGTLQRLIGWNAPPPNVYAPLTGQPANVHLRSAYAAASDGNELAQAILGPKLVVPSSFHRAATAEGFDLSSALALLMQGDVAAAGNAFRETRQTLDRDGALADAEYALCTLGEANWFAGADAATYGALDRVRNQAAQSGNSELLSHERLARANLVRRTHGSAATALELLTANVTRLQDSGGQTNIKDPAERLIYLQSLMGRFDIHMQHAAERTRDARNAAYTRAIAELHEINYLLQEEGPGENRAQERFIASELHAFAIRQMMAHGYSLRAREIAGDLFRLYPETLAAESMASAESPIAPLLDDKGRLRELRARGHWGAAVSAGLAEATHSSGGDYWAISAVGALTAMAWGALAGHHDAPTLMQFSGAGATFASGARKLMNGFASPEAGQALATGYSIRTPLQTMGDSAARVGELGATYMIYGGAVPGLQSLAGVPVVGHLVTNASGNTAQLHGPGSAMAGLVSPALQQGSALWDLIGRSGFADGLSQFWKAFSGSTTFGSGVSAFLGADHRFLSWVGGNPLNGVRGISPGSLEIKDLATVMEVGAGIWAGATMFSPELRNRAIASHPRLTRALELSLLPGAWLLATDFALSLGVAPKDAWVIPGLAVGFQARDQLMSGIRPTGWDFSNFLRAPLLEVTYAGVGAQMLLGAIRPHTFSESFGASMAIQIGLIPIGFAHALLLGFGQLRLWQNKALRSFSAETLGNFFRIMFGWSTWGGTLASMVCQTFIQCPWMTRVASEPVAGASMRGDFREKIAAPKADAAQKLLTQAAQAGTRWRFWMPLTGRTLVEHLSPFLAFAFTTRGKDEPFETRPEERYFMMVSSMLAAGGKKAVPAADAAHYLNMLDQLAVDLEPGRRQARRGLLIATWAARSGPHGDAIRKFFGERDWLFDHYSISRDMGTPPPRWGRARWFRTALRTEK
ncbi:MAG: hypothetical protein V2A66_01220 [Pseudomonadota bacterium]